MAVICDMAKGRLADRRYFFESVHDGIKTDFTTDKAASSYIKIFNVLLPTNSSKQRKDNQCLTPMMSSECVSRYCDLLTTETKELSFFIYLVNDHISPCRLCLFDDMRVDMK